MSNYISIKTLAQRFDVTRSTIERWVKEDKLPAPVKINGSIRWSEDEINQWLVGLLDGPTKEITHYD